MNVIILMAGEGKRFTDKGIKTPKPFIQVNGKTILEWTTRSLPFITHDGSPQQDLYLALRNEHEYYLPTLREIYGNDINVTFFSSTTRGNLETALIVALMIPPSERTKPLIVLDSDNKYDCNNIQNMINQCGDGEMFVTAFDPIDDDDKWAFAVTDVNGKVTEIVEKDSSALCRGGKPMIGTFYFSSVDMFVGYATYLVDNNIRSGKSGMKEFYVSQVPGLHAHLDGIVHCHIVKNVVPLGTPDDVKIFDNDFCF